MIDFIPLDVGSLKVIKPELAASLQTASQHFEAFVADRKASAPLTQSESCIGDIVGILKMLQMPGALQLAEEMLTMLRKIIEQPAAASDFSIAALSQAFVWMPCNLEYVADSGQVIPSLALPFINELRAALHEPLILESELAEFNCAVPIDLVAIGHQKDPDLASLVPRLLLMYQVGLLGLLREQNLEMKIKFMRRSVARLSKSVGDAPVRTQWRLTEAVLEGLSNGDLQLNYTRKRVLSLIEREFRLFEKDFDNDAITASSELLNELVYLVNLSGSSKRASSEVFDTLRLEAFEATDRIFQQEKAVMLGPDAETISIMAEALKEDLAESKEILEIAARNASGKIDTAQLISLFQRTSDILSVIGLQTPGEIVASIRNDIESWADHSEYNPDNLQKAADGLLYVESTLESLSRRDLNFTADTEQTKRALMTKNQLDEAEIIVIREAQAGIAESKNQIAAFIEYNYDVVHIQNVIETLVTVRGGVQILQLNRAADVLVSCEKYFQSVVDKGIDENQIQSVLETMADALIALEYYLSEIELHGVAPPNVLDIAEQSLSAHS